MTTTIRMKMKPEHSMTPCEALDEHMRRNRQAGTFAIVSLSFAQKQAEELFCVLSENKELLEILDSALTHWHSNARNMQRKEPAWLEQARAAIARAKEGE